MPSRTRKQVTDLMEVSKLQLSKFYEKSQVLVTSHETTGSDLFLMEINPLLAEKLLGTGNELVGTIKAEVNSSNENPAYICTEDKTFKILEVESSNSLLLVPKLLIPFSSSDKFASCNHKEDEVEQCEVIAIKNFYLESTLVPAPNLYKLKKLLLNSIFVGHIDEEDMNTNIESDLYSFESLRHILPCSSEQLLLSLDYLHVFVWMGKLRMMEVEYLNQILQTIFHLADEHAWNWVLEGMPALEVVELLADLYPRVITQQVLRSFFFRRHSFGGLAGKLGVFPRVAKICQLVGEHLLSVTTRFALPDFLAVWCAAVPRGMQPRLRRHLTSAGRAVCESRLGMATASDCAGRRVERGQSISLLRSEDLPGEAVEVRLEMLFGRKPVWLEAELAGYMVDLITSAPTHNTLSVPISLTDEIEVLSDIDDELELVDFNEIPPQEDAINISVFDDPPPVPANISTVLNQLCRASGSSSQRIYTEKYPRH